MHLHSLDGTKNRIQFGDTKINAPIYNHRIKFSLRSEFLGCWIERICNKHRKNECRIYKRIGKVNLELSFAS